jgi:hypothetical protein
VKPMPNCRMPHSHPSTVIADCPTHAMKSTHELLYILVASKDDKLFAGNAWQIGSLRITVNDN